MKVLVLTREYPPNVYGGAGVVVDQLTRALGRRLPMEVRCFGDPDAPPPGVAVRGLLALGARAQGRGGSAVRSGPGGAVGRARHGARPGGRPPRSRAHVVRERGRAARADAPQDPPGRDTPQPR